MSNETRSTLLSHYQNLLPKSIPSDINLSKRCCSSTSYRQRLKRLQDNCQLIRQRRRCATLFPIQPIELHSNVFQQRFYRIGSLETLNIRAKHWQTTNLLQLSDEYLYKCKYAMYASTRTSLNADEFARFLKELFSYPMENENDDIQCSLCSNQFHSHELYQLHLHRQSLSIEYRCLTCQSWIKSTNPCQAYLHLSSHQHSTKNSIEELQINSDWTNSLTFLDNLIA